MQKNTHRDFTGLTELRNGAWAFPGTSDNFKFPDYGIEGTGFSDKEHSKSLPLNLMGEI